MRGDILTTKKHTSQNPDNQYAVLTILILVLSTWGALEIGAALPVLGSSIAAILIGVIIRHTPLYQYLDKGVTGFVSSYLLKTGIVLLGFNLSLGVISEIGLGVLALLICGFIVSILVGTGFGKLLGMDSTLSILIGIGTSICGGSAIIASGPILDAEDRDIAVSISTMLLFSLVALVLLPLLGVALGYSGQEYGILAGAAVNDTPSVIATAFDWSEVAGVFATITKMVRTLFIVPVVLGLIVRQFHLKNRQPETEDAKLDISFKGVASLVPTFVVLFILAVIFTSLVPLADPVLSLISSTSGLLMTLALVTIGMGVHFVELKQAGFKPILLSALCWLAVVLNAVLFIYFLY